MPKVVFCEQRYLETCIFFNGDSPQAMWIRYIAVGLLVVLVIGRLTSKSTGRGFGNLGLVAGLALGLSASPVLAATITAVFTLAGVLVPIYLRPPQGGVGVEEPAVPSTPQWLGPLAGWLAVGLIFGIFLRANDALNFSHNLRSRYMAQGFNEEQINRIMDGQTATLAKQSAVATTVERDKTNLQSHERAEAWAKVLSDLIRPNDTPEMNVQRLKKGVTKDDRERMEWLEAQGLSPAQVLDAVKTWHPKHQPDTPIP